MSRGRPTLTESNRAIVLISSRERPQRKHIFLGADKPAFDRASNRKRETQRARPRDNAPEYIRSLQHRKAPQTASEFAVFLLSHPNDTLVAGDGDFSVALVFCQMFKHGGNAIRQHIGGTFIWVEAVRV